MAKAIGSTKWCPKCSAFKGLECFGPDKRTTTGRTSYCRECSKERSAAAREAKRVASGKPIRRKLDLSAACKICPRCEIELPLSEFAKCRQKRDGLKSWCRNCTKVTGKAYRDGLTPEQKAASLAADRVWRAANPEKLRAYVREWQQQNPEANLANNKRWRKANGEKVRMWARACYGKRKGAPGTYSKDDIDDIFRLQRGRCAYCRASIKSGYHVDHIKPLSLGGDNNRQNLQLTCQACNCKKHASDPITFAQKLGRLI